MKNAAGTKENKGLDRSKDRRDLVLVAPKSKRSSREVLEIGICEDVFAPRPAKKVKTPDIPSDRELKKDSASMIARPQTLIVFAIAGLILGYLIGRRDSDEGRH